MSLFVIGDTHLSLSVDKPMDVFGSRWRDYTEKLETAWRAYVKEGDTVIIPGDISWGMSLSEAEKDLRFLHSLPGKKILGKGNHDFWWVTRKKIEDMFKAEGIDSIELLYNNAFICEGKAICGSRGWFTDDKNAPPETDYEKLMLRESMRLRASFEAANKLDPYAEKLCFLHFPPVFSDFRAEELLSVIYEYGVKRCYFGHIHSLYDIEGTVEYEGVKFSIISSDYLNFVPLKLD
ncbi:MAG: serine/threonine protein phosphatase [Ruminococcaceae bacterium]|nr:serine/threonine protein phosphatase [Oscillospiraceae bacterium]